MNPICAKCKYKDNLPRPECWNINPHYMHLDENAPTVMVISTRPTVEDVDSGIPLSDDPGNWMREMLGKLNCNICYDHAVRCQSPGKPLKKIYDTCSHWKSVVVRCQPKVILCLGLDTAKSVLDKYNMTLAQLRSGVWDLDVDGHKCKVVVTDHPATHSSFMPYERGGRDLRSEYKGMLRTVHAIAHDYFMSTDVSYETIDDYQKAMDKAPAISQSYTELSFDVETHNPGINIFHPDSELLCFGTSFWSSDIDRYVTYVFHCRGWSRAEVAEVISTLLDDKIAVGTNIQYDIQCVWRFSGLNLRNVVRRVHDTMFLSYLPNQLELGNGLEDQGLYKLGIPRYKAYTDAALAEQKKLHPKENVTYGYLPKDFLCKYQAMDVWVQIRVWREYFKGSEARVNFHYVYELMINAMWALLEVERNGLPINLDKLRLLREKTEETVSRTQAWLDKHPFTTKAGLQKVNVKSPLQLAKLAKATRIEPKFVSAKTGLASMDKEEVARWADKDGTVVGKFWFAIQTAIKARDRLSKFVDKYEQHSYGGYARGIYSLTKTEDAGGIDSGRVGCRDLPNNTLQNVYDIKSVFECPPDEEFICYDFSSAEPVILGILSNCEKYHEIFRLKATNPNDPMGDLYKRNASRFWNKDMAFWEGDKKTWNPLRQKSKALNLGLNYLMSPKTMSITYDIPIEECAEFYKFYFREYPEIQLFIAGTLRDAFLNKPCYSPSGRCIQRDLSRIYDYDYDKHKTIPFFELMELLDITGPDGHILRKMVNFKIQSTTSDCMIAQMAWFSAYMHKHPDVARVLKLLNPVHDSLWWSCKTKHIPWAHRFIKGRMENPDTYNLYRFKIDFPDQKLLVVEGERGRNLGEKVAIV